MPTDSIVTCADVGASMSLPMDFHGACRQAEIQEQMQGFRITPAPYEKMQGYMQCAAPGMRAGRAKEEGHATRKRIHDPEVAHSLGTGFEVHREEACQDLAHGDTSHPSHMQETHRHSCKTDRR